MLTAPGERRIVGGGEVEAHHPEQGVREPFGLTQREMVDEPQGQGGLDGEIRVPPLPAPPAAPAGRPGTRHTRLTPVPMLFLTLPQRWGGPHPPGATAVKTRARRLGPRPSVANDRLRHMQIGSARVSKADGGSQALDLQRELRQTPGFSERIGNSRRTAKRLFRKALTDPSHPQPRVINTDQARLYGSAIAGVKKEGLLRRRCRHRPVQYLNNILEQDHRAIKRRVKAKQGFREFQAARRTIQGYEAMHMIRKGQARWVSGSDVRRQIQFINNLFEVAA